MKYRLPEKKDINILKEYVEEHYANHEKSISASVGMTSMNFDEWIEKVHKNVEIPDDEWGKYYLYLVFNEENKLVGLLNIRFSLKEDLRKIYGDIGYGVRPSERRKGYATQMLEYALQICKENNMSEVIIGCYANNYGSNKVILNNGGVLFRNDDEDVVISSEWNIKLKNNYYKITF